MKSSLELNKVVLLGRTLEEYARYFGLNLPAWRGRNVLDIASGVSSFCAEANAQDIQTTAFDPIYALSPDEIRQRAEPDLAFIAQEIGQVKAYKWDFYKNPEGMKSYRERAYQTFLADFQKYKGVRYLPGQLPQTSFRDGQFDLTLASYLLFVYEDQFRYEFHQASLREIMRITCGEARIYPLVNFKGERCVFVDRIKQDPTLKDLHFEEVKTDFEFLANSNSFLRITRKP